MEKNCGFGDMICQGIMEKHFPCHSPQLTGRIKNINHYSEKKFFLQKFIKLISVYKYPRQTTKGRNVKI